jgi:hypothetical protein
MDRPRMNNSHYAENESTKLTALFVIAQKFFILKELAAVNKVDGVLSIRLTGEFLARKNLQGLYVCFIRSNLRCKLW